MITTADTVVLALMACSSGKVCFVGAVFFLHGVLIADMHFGGELITLLIVVFCWENFSPLTDDKMGISLLSLLQSHQVTISLEIANSIAPFSYSIWGLKRGLQHIWHSIKASFC